TRDAGAPGAGAGTRHPHGLDPADWRPGAKEPFVLAAGRVWDEAKGIATLVACAGRLPWPIRIAGPTAAAGRSGATGRPGLELLRDLSADVLADWMARASIYALPVRYEPFGLSILEAALAGCPLVLGAIDSMREVWGDAASYVPPGDAEALRAALAELIVAD